MATLHQLRQKLTETIQNYGMDPFEPLFHGTSKKNWENMQLCGQLAPRNKTGMCSVWNNSHTHDISSQLDRVYFNICRDNMAVLAARKATNYNLDDAVILRLKNPLKYQKNWVMDEDGRMFYKNFERSAYNYDLSANKNVGDLGICNPWIPEKITALLDLIWKDYGTREVLKAAKEIIPPYLAGIWEAQSFAIKGGVDIDDLEPLTLDEYHKYKKACNISKYPIACGRTDDNYGNLPTKQMIDNAFFEAKSRTIRNKEVLIKRGVLPENCSRSEYKAHFKKILKENVDKLKEDIKKRYDFSRLDELDAKVL